MSKSIFKNIAQTPKQLWLFLLFSILFDGIQAAIAFTAVMCLIPSITGVGVVFSTFCYVVLYIGALEINILGGIIGIAANIYILKNRGAGNWILFAIPSIDFLASFFPPAYILIGFPSYTIWSIYNILFVDKREFG